MNNKLFNFSFIKTRDNTSNKILNAALLWFGIGFLIVFSLGYGMTEIPFLQQIFARIMGTTSGIIFLSVASIGLFLVMVFALWKIPLSGLIAIFFVMCLIESFYIGFVFYAFASDLSNLLLVFTIPAFTFGLMGLLGYFQVINFGKLFPFLFFATFGLIIFGIVIFFVQNSFTIMLYSVLGYFLMSLYVGFDMWRISRMDELYRGAFENDKVALTRLGIIFGLFLLMDFVRLVIFLAQILFLNRT